MFVGIVTLNSLVAVLLFLGKKKSRMVFFVTNLAIAGNVIMYKDKEVKKNVKNIFLSMCDVKVSLTFTSLNMVLL
jgi:hypothetical protein